jgi:hypothetical protein
MTVVLRSGDVHAPKGESHGVAARVTKALVPQSSVSRHGTNICISKERSVFTGKSLKVRKIGVHDEDEVATWVSGRGLSDSRVMETDVVSVPEMLLRDDAWGTTCGYIRRVGIPNPKLTGVAIFIDKVKLDEPVAMNVNINTFDVDGVRNRVKLSGRKAKR